MSITKYILIAFSALLMSSPALAWKDGTYQGTADGKDSTITATVTIKDGAIAEVKLEAEDTPDIWDTARDTLAERIVKNQSTDVKNVTGATISSDGIKAAVEQALEKAK